MLDKGFIRTCVYMWKWIKVTTAVLPLTIEYMYTVVARWRSPVDRVAGLSGLNVQAHYLSRWSH